MHRDKSMTPAKYGNLYGKFTPSPIIGVHFVTSTGTKIIPMNRKTRRANKIKRRV